MKIENLCINCMKEKPDPNGICPYCGADNKEYVVPAHHLKPFTFLNGKYVIGRSIGEGGFGITYLAMDLYLEIVVAIKELYISGLVVRDRTRVIIKDATMDGTEYFEENKRRFLNEAKTLALLQEKDRRGIVEVRDYFLENGTAYIVMEYLRGINLRELLKQNEKKYTYGEIKKMMRPVMDSLEKVHAAQIIHRDISPDNLMVLEDGTMKILDFGGAKDKRRGEESQIIAVKKGYTPVEQYQINGNIGPWTDIYALCATIYRCMTGNVPPEPSQTQAPEIRKPSQYGVSIPAKAEAALMKGLSWDPRLRYQNVASFAADFIQEEDPEEIKDVLIPPKPINKVRFAAAAIVVLTAGILAGMILGKMGTRSREEEKKAEVTVSPTDTVNITPKAEEQEQTETDDLEEDKAEGDLSGNKDEQEPLYAEGEVFPLTEGTYQLQSIAYPEQAIGIYRGCFDDGAYLVLEACQEVNSQKFYIVKQDSGRYKLIAAHSNKNVESVPQEVSAEGLIGQYSEGAAAETEWEFLYAGENTYVIQNAEGKCVEASDNRVFLNDYHAGAEGQKWKFIWTEATESNIPMITVNTGEYTTLPDGYYRFFSVYKPSMYLTMSQDPEALETPVIVWENAWSNAQVLHIVNGENGECSISPYLEEGLSLYSQTDSAGLFCEAKENAFCWRLVYGGYGSVMLQADDGRLITYPSWIEAENHNGLQVEMKSYEEAENANTTKWFFEMYEPAE